MSNRIAQARRSAALHSAIVEALESRQLLSAPHVQTPPGPDAFSRTPDGHFNMETGPQRLVFDFNAPVSIPDKRALYLSNLTTGGNPVSSNWSLAPSNNGATQTFNFNQTGANFSAGS